MVGRPIVVRQDIPVKAATATPAWVSMFTCMFLHGGWMHLIGNMLYLWIFGNNIEDRLGPVLFLVFYIGTGVVANLAHTFFEMSWIPLVGASGAISGVMGGYIMLFPRARILAVVPVYYYMYSVKLPAWVFLLIYVVLQNLVPAFGGGGPVAYWAHIGGFVGGLALIHLFPHRKIPATAQARPIDDDDADFVL
jgi:membrane associated rhomboid family serine protease